MVIDWCCQYWIQTWDCIWRVKPKSDMNIHFARPLEVGRPSNLVPRPSLASTFSCNIIPLTYSTLLDTWFNLFSTHHKTQQSRVKLAGSDRWLLLADYAFVEFFGNWLNLSIMILNLRLYPRMDTKSLIWRHSLTRPLVGRQSKTHICSKIFLQHDLLILIIRYLIGSILKCRKVLPL